MKSNESRHHISTSGLHRQMGATLIGLMVGLLVSMIGILGSLSLYKTLTQASVDATFDTKHDGNASMTLSRVAFELQSAGFGLPDVEAGVTWPHLTIVSAQNVIWRVGQNVSAAADQVNCKQIIETAATQDGAGVASPDVKEGIQARKLVLMSTDSSTTATCDDKSDLAAVDWSGASEEILSITELSRLKQDFANNNALALIDISTTNTGAETCSPYGMVPTTQDTLITLSHFSSADLNIAKENAQAPTRSLSYDVCIGNSAL